MYTQLDCRVVVYETSQVADDWGLIICSSVGQSVIFLKRIFLYTYFYNIIAHVTNDYTPFQHLLLSKQSCEITTQTKRLWSRAYFAKAALKSVQPIWALQSGRIFHDQATAKNWKYHLRLPYNRLSEMMLNAYAVRKIFVPASEDNQASSWSRASKPVPTHCALLGLHGAAKAQPFFYSWTIDY